jgi:hypothetical protein
MTPDISLCMTKDFCPQRAYCLRATAKPYTLGQAYIFPEYNEKRECQNFWNNGVEQTPAKDKRREQTDMASTK